VSAKTTAVVAGVEPGAAKLARALELGIPVLDEAGFAELLETGRLPGAEREHDDPGVQDPNPEPD
jgi:DNA ligase (NAD+)